MAFLIHSIDNANVVPWEYLPAGAIQPEIGKLLTLSSGQLAVAGATAKPQYVSMAQYGSAVSAGTVIPVIKVRDDIVFETTFSTSASDRKVGDAVTTANGMQATATTTNGVATIVGIDSTASGGKVRVRFL